jgi:signal transduction histidine kinase
MLLDQFGLPSLANSWAAVRRWCLGALLVMGVGGVAAQDLVTERAFFEDPSGTMELAQVIDAPFQSADFILNRGVTRSAVWMRFLVRAPVRSGELTLHLLPAVLDEVTLYAPQAGDHTQFQRVDLSAWPPKAEYAWLVDDGPQPGAYYYVRVANSRALIFSAQVLDTPGYRRVEITSGIFFGAVVACLAFVLLGLLLLFVQRREMLNVFLAVNLASSFVLFVAWFGYWRDYPAFGHFATRDVHQYLVLVDMASGIGFHWALLSRFGLSRWMRKIVWVCGASFVGLFVGLPFLDAHLLAKSALVVCGLSAAVLVWLVPLSLVKHRPAQRVVGGVAMFFLLTVTYSCAALLGWVSAASTDMSLPAWRMLVTPVLFGFVAWLVDRDTRSQLQLAQANDVLSKRFALDEAQRRQTQSRFMTMLMHEVKTPLSIVQLASASLARSIAPDSKDTARIQSIDRAVEDLNGLIERCGQADRLAEGADKAKLQMQTFRLQTLIGDVLESVGAERIEVRAPGKASLKSDYQYLRLILLNLLGNALKYSAPRSTVVLTIAAAERDGVAGLAMQVENQMGAAGYPDPGKVFSRYYRAEGARSQMGAGLGLWLSQEVARQLGTEISLRTQPGCVIFAFWTPSA